MRNWTVNIKGERESIHRAFQGKVDYIKERHPNLTSTASVIEFALDLLYMKEKGEIILFTEKEVQNLRILKKDQVDLSKIKEIKVPGTHPGQEQV